LAARLQQPVRRRRCLPRNSTGSVIIDAIIRADDTTGKSVGKYSRGGRVVVQHERTRRYDFDLRN
jgi:hypothetical protein